MEKLPKKVESPKVEKKLKVISKMENTTTVSKMERVDSKVSRVNTIKPEPEQGSFSLEKLQKFVAKWEWEFQYDAFCDDYYKTKTKLIRKVWKDCQRWNIWYWTKSYWGEEISLEEWIKRRNKDLVYRNSLIKSTCLNENQRIAVVDFLYQHGVNSWIRRLANDCKIKEVYYRIVWWRDLYESKEQYWMVKREQLRINIFYK